MDPLDIDEIVYHLRDLRPLVSGKRFLITGSQGFLGRYFVETLLQMNILMQAEGFDPCEIIAMDNMVTAGKLGEEVTSDKAVTFTQQDVIQPFYPEKPVDYILHLAGIASPYYYRKMPLETLDVATKGLRNVLEVARISKARILFFSSSEIYGDPDPRFVPTNEEYRGYVSSMGARACYDESKRLGETLVKIYQTQYGTAGMIVRPFNVYGPGMQKTDYRVLPNFAAKIISGEPVDIYEPGTQTRTFCYITDAIEGFLRVLFLGLPGEAYNIGKPSPELTMRELFDRIRLTYPQATARIIPHPSTYPADEPQRRCPDISKAEVQVGYRPRVDIDTGLQRFFDWAKKTYPVS